MHHAACDCHLEIHAVLCVEKWLAAKRSHFLVITLGNLDHLFLYAAGNRRDQKSDLALQASCPGGPKKVRGEGQSHPFSFTRFCVFVHLPPHTLSESGCTYSIYAQTCVLYAQTGWQRRKGGWWYFLGGRLPYNVVQSNDSERTRHISMQPPSTQHALLSRSSGTTLWPTSEPEREKERERGRIMLGDEH